MKYLIGNLKMNLSYLESQNYLNELQSLNKIKNFKNVIVGAALSFDAMSLSLQYNKRNFLFGVQNIFYKEKGAYTGEVSFRSAVELNIDFVLIGHSERRKLFNETDQLINLKIKQIEKTSIIPILCIGEDQENCSDKVFEDIIKNQILKALEDVDVYNRLIISYEPTYCIGNGKIPQNNHIEKAISVIKKITNNQVPVLYGGSVSQKNIEKLLEIKDLDGFLVGGAALDAQGFLEIGSIIEKSN